MLLDRVLLCNPDWLGTQRSACFCLLSTGIKDLSHHAQPLPLRSLFSLPLTFLTLKQNSKYIFPTMFLTKLLILLSFWFYCVCVYICMCMYACVCISMYLCGCMYICVHVEPKSWHGVFSSVTHKNGLCLCHLSWFLSSFWRLCYLTKLLRHAFIIFKYFYWGKRIYNLLVIKKRHEPFQVESMIFWVYLSSSTTSTINHL